MPLTVLYAVLSAVLVTGCASPPSAPEPTAPAPEAASGWTDKPGWVAQRWMVATANPLATQVGYEVLKAGGSAVDAAIAVQMVLTLVEPQSSGIGGGALMVHFDGRRVQAFDGRETAPMAASETLFFQDHQPMSFPQAAVGGRAVGVPGVVRMLAMVHAQHGRRPWAELFEPAIALAEKGFAISPRLAGLIQRDPHLALDPQTRSYFYQADGQPKTAGMLLRNPALARTLRAIAQHGPAAFYQGELAQAMVDTVQTHPRNPGLLQRDDLAQYHAKERDALCFDYRKVQICGMPPPSSGTVALAQILGMLEGDPLAALAPTRGSNGRWQLPAQAVHLYSEAARLAYADRARYVADPDYITVPVAALLAPAYLKQRRQLIGERSMGTAIAGRLAEDLVHWGTDQSPERPSTSQISIVDGQGHALSMTTTIEDAFGSRQMVGGFLLNNQLTDFSLVPRDAQGQWVANRVQGGKRPRSSMTPLLVFDRESHQLLMTLGSPGGSAIINYVGKVLIGTVDWGLNVQEAINLPNYGSRNGPTELELDRIDPQLVPALVARGHQVQLIEQTSGVQGIQRITNGWLGGADPRREGTARGE